MSEYYASYVPKNERHFHDMLRQFRLAKDKAAFDGVTILWTLSPDVDRQDILVALGRVERENRSKTPSVGEETPT